MPTSIHCLHVYTILLSPLTKCIILVVVFKSIQQQISNSDKRHKKGT